MTGKGKTLKVDVFRQDEKQRGKNRSPEGQNGSYIRKVRDAGRTEDYW